MYRQAAGLEEKMEAAETTRQVYMKTAISYGVIKLSRINPAGVPVTNSKGPFNNWFYRESGKLFLSINQYCLIRIQPL
jgi:hypothetical protein